jgi:hypothetical protein
LSLAGRQLQSCLPAIIGQRHLIASLHLHLRRRFPESVTIRESSRPYREEDKDVKIAFHDGENPQNHAKVIKKSSTCSGAVPLMRVTSVYLAPFHSVMPKTFVGCSGQFLTVEQAIQKGEHTTTETILRSMWLGVGGR